MRNHPGSIRFVCAGLARATMPPAAAMGRHREGAQLGLCTLQPGQAGDPPLLSWQGRSSPGTAPVTQVMAVGPGLLMLSGARESPCHHRLRGVCSCCLASPHSQHLLLSPSGIGAKPRHCCSPVGYAQAQGSTDPLGPFQLGPRLQEGGQDRAGDSSAIACGHPLAQVTWGP